MMTCHELIDFLDAYLEGEITTAERVEFERHLALCPPCVAYVDTYRKSCAMAREALVADETVGAEVPEDLVRAILAARERAQ